MIIRFIIIFTLGRPGLLELVGLNLVNHYWCGGRIKIAA